MHPDATRAYDGAGSRARTEVWHGVDPLPAVCQGDPRRLAVLPPVRERSGLGGVDANGDVNSYTVGGVAAVSVGRAPPPPESRQSTQLAKPLPVAIEAAAAAGQARRRQRVGRIRDDRGGDVHVRVPHPPRHHRADDLAPARSRRADPDESGAQRATAAVLLSEAGGFVIVVVVIVGSPLYGRSADPRADTCAGEGVGRSLSLARRARWPGARDDRVAPGLSRNSPPLLT